MIILQEITETARELPENYKLLWIVSQIVVTGIVFVGVYFIFKPLFNKKKDNDAEDKD